MLPRRHAAGLRPLAVHVDVGGIPNPAVRNIENLTKGLGIELYPCYRLGRDEGLMPVAYLKSGVANQDVPQDRA